MAHNNGIPDFSEPYPRERPSITKSDVFRALMQAEGEIERTGQLSFATGCKLFDIAMATKSGVGFVPDAHQQGFHSSVEG